MDEQKAYIEDQQTVRLQHWAGVAAIIGVVLWPLFGLVDYFGKSQIFREFLPLRVGMAFFCLLLFMMTRIRRTRRYLYTICYIGILASAVLNEYLALRVSMHTAPYYDGMIPIIVVAVALIPMPGSGSILLGVLIYLVYIIPVFLLDRVNDLSRFILNNLFLISVLSITIVIRIVSNKSIVNELRLKHHLSNERNLLDRLVKVKTADLNKSEQWHRSIFENATDGLLILSKNGVIAEANDMACKIMNISRDRMAGMHARDLFKEEQWQELDSIFDRMVRVKSIVLELAYTTGDGKSVSLEISLQDMPIGDEHHILMVMRDITEKKLYREQLAQNQKMESIAAFAGGIAHDVRNIITSMIAYIEIVRNDKGVSERTLQRTNLLDKSIRNAGNMISQLLTFARKSKSALAETGLNDVVRDTLNIIEASIGENIEITHSLWKNELVIQANVNQIESVIMNLVINARDAMPGGGRIEISTEVADMSGPQEKSWNKPGDKYAVLTVADTGIGIPAEVQPRIFEPFFTTKKQGNGTGLGLAMVYSILSDHKGHITAESEPGKGSRFKIYFPLLEERPYIDKKQESVIESSSDIIVHTEHATNASILFVDDDLALMTMMSDALEARGYKVISTTSSEEALAILQKDPGEIPLLITDMAMPRMDGSELVRRVRALRPGIKVIIISAFNHDKIDQMLNGMNVSERLLKPFAPSEFVTAVRNILESDLRTDRREAVI